MLTTWLEEKEREKRIQRYLNLVMLAVWIEEIRRHMQWEDNLLDAVLNLRNLFNYQRQRKEPKKDKTRKTALFRANNQQEKVHLVKLSQVHTK